MRGTINVNQMVSICRLDGTTQQFRITKLFGFLGLKRIEIESAQAGDIVAIAGYQILTLEKRFVKLVKKKHYLFYTLMSQH